MSDEDTLLEIEESSEEDNKEDTAEEVVEEVAEETDTVPSVRTVPLTDLEYSSLSKTLNTIKAIKQTLSEQPHQSASEHMNLLEISIWDDVVKKFGFNSVEAAQTAGYTFGLKSVYVVECAKKQ